MRGRRLPGTMGRRRSPRRTSVPSTARRAPAPTAAAARRSLAGATAAGARPRAPRAPPPARPFSALAGRSACPPPPAAAPRRRRRRAAHAARAAAAAAAAAARPRLASFPAQAAQDRAAARRRRRRRGGGAMAAAAAGVTAAIGAVAFRDLRNAATSSSGASARSQRSSISPRRRSIAVRSAAGDGEVESASAVKQTVASATIVEITLVHFTARLHSVKLAPAFSSSRRAGRE